MVFLHDARYYHDCLTLYSHRINVEGILFFHQRVCRACLLELSFSDPLCCTRNAFIVTVIPQTSVALGVQVRIPATYPQYVLHFTSFAGTRNSHLFCISRPLMELEIRIPAASPLPMFSACHSCPVLQLETRIPVPYRQRLLHFTSFAGSRNSHSNSLFPTFSTFQTRSPSQAARQPGSQTARQPDRQPGSQPASLTNQSNSHPVNKNSQWSTTE